MKFIRNFLIIIFAAIFMIFADNAFCSDNALVQNQTTKTSSSVQPNQSIQYGQTQNQTQQQAAPVSSQKTQEPISPPQNKGFMGNFVNMLGALVKVVLLILLIGGILLLYKKIRTGDLSFSLPAFNLPQNKLKQRKKQAKTSGEPSDVSEAVSSFIKHRIKK